ncbi:LacI family DNA-binding transcriptional regulator [Botrimarina hoheduenensis]|uniref:Catabolite control protein A n=1 Tax=Botrimarina hoheduenensis TaxID=2528000 RepID=A0A5C5VQC2_9BACT|nr:LacI family DNA-binding transcriptional regulator [Botrimarina hoheduenensis]TWT40838.1 Catabolite control protein A [Botrimarina hoheduenensis]
MPSIRQVAHNAGVSIATVSRVLNGNASVNADLRARVLEAAEACRYVPTVGRRTAERIALVYATDHFSVASPYDSACIDGIVSAMRSTAYDLVVIEMARDRHPGESLEAFFARKGVCGAIVRSSYAERSKIIEMASEGPPLVVLGDHFDNPQVHFCYADSRAASREATEHLVSLGHRAIAFACCDVDDGDHMDRFEAFRSVMEEAGLYREDFVHRVPPFRMDGAPLIRRILSRSDRPTALFIADPLVAVGVLNEAKQLGVDVPGELSIVAVDDSDTRNMVHPRLTSVCQDSKRLGVQAYTALVEMVEGGRSGVLDAQQQAWFELHDSTAPPPSEINRFLPSPRSKALR